MDIPKDGCAKPAQGVIRPAGATTATLADPPEAMEEQRMLARVGYEAPDFETTAYLDGAFSNIKLSDFRGRWILLCFYPGDFTFV